MADTIRVGLDRLVLDALVSEAFEKRVEPGDGEGDPARARPGRVRLDEEPGALADLPENRVPDATVWGSPEEPCLPIDAGVEIGYRDTGEEVRDRARLTAGYWTNARQGGPDATRWPPSRADFRIRLPGAARAIVETAAPGATRISAVGEIAGN